MSTTKPETRIDSEGRPPRPWLVPSPDSLTFNDMFRIKAATGVDVLDPVTRAHAIVACLWLASREWDKPLTWEECTRANLDDLELAGEDEELDPETDEADPTHGSETPSSE